MLLVLAAAEVERRAADLLRDCAMRTNWHGRHPTVLQMQGDYPTGVIVPKAEMKELNKRLERSESLGKYDIIIRPVKPRGR